MSVPVPSFCLTLTTLTLHVSQNPQTSQLPKRTEQRSSALITCSEEQFCEVNKPGVIGLLMLTKLIKTNGAKIRNRHFTAGRISKCHCLHRVVGGGCSR